MKKKSVKIMKSLILIALVLLVSSCTQRKLILEALSEAQYAKLQKKYSQASFAPPSTGKTRDAWKVIFRDVLSNDIFKSSLYSGLSNTHELGDILYRDEGNFKLYSKLNKTMFSDSDMEKIIAEANIAETASYTKSDTSSAELLIGELSDLKILKGISLEFESMIRNNSSIDVTINQHQIKELALGDFLEMINSDTNKKTYKKALLGGNRYLITRLVVVKGYSITAEFNKDISAELKVNLLSLIQTDSTNVNKISFGYNGQRTITLENANEFVPFIQFTKAKKIRKNEDHS